jgi:hypothetical protein
MENGGDVNFVSVAYDDTLVFVRIIDYALYFLSLGVFSRFQ